MWLIVGSQEILYCALWSIPRPQNKGPLMNPILVWSCYVFPQLLYSLYPPSVINPFHLHEQQQCCLVICANGKCFGFVNTGQKGLEVNTTVGRKTDTWKIIILNIHGTSFCGLSILSYVLLLYQDQYSFADFILWLAIRSTRVSICSISG